MQKIKLRDFLLHQYPSGVRFSPDGAHCAFSVKRINEDGNCYEHNLYVWSRRTGQCEQLTFENRQNDFLWEDAEHLLYFVKEQEPSLADLGPQAVWTAVKKINVRTRETSCLMRLPYAVSRMKKVHDGLYAFCAPTNLSRPNLLTMQDAEREEAAKRMRHTAGYQTVTELPMTEDGTGIVSGDRTTLFLCDANGTVRQVTDDTWDVNHLDVCGDALLFTAFPFTDIKKMTEGLYRYSLESEHTETLLEDDRYSIDYAAFWRGGVLCLALEMNTYGAYEHPSFFFVDHTGVQKLLHYDRRVTNAVVTDSHAGGRCEQRVVNDKLYFLTTEGTNGPLCTFTPEEGVRTLIGGTVSLLDFDVWQGDVAAAAFNGQGLPEVYLFSGADRQKLTALNEEVLKDRLIGEPEPVCFRNSDGVEIDGFVLKPAGYDPALRYPAILHIHGGPKMVFSTVFHHEMQVWAAEGYFVCYCNPRGSCGKGNEFAELRGRLGTVDYRDLMEFTDECLRRFPAIDAARVGVCGGSYGGFMTNWIIGHTDRFRCAVSQRSISDYRTDYLLSDIGYWFVPDQHRGTLWEHEEGLWNDSPLKYAPQVKTPTLFIHSDLDYRCPMTNGLEMFAALKLHGAETKLCLFHGEGHGLSRTGSPRNRICRMEEILAWLDAHLKG